MLAENIVILSLLHVTRLILPLLVIPIIARTVSGAEFGTYMYAMSFSAWIATVLEYGFNISSTRAVAGAKTSAERAVVIRGTQSGKAILAGSSAMLCAILLVAVPGLRSNWLWTLSAWLLGVAVALHPIYYFQGRESMRVVGSVELAVGAATLLLVVAVVRQAGDFYRLPLILVATRLASLMFLTFRMQAHEGTTWRDSLPRRDGVVSLVQNFDLFVFQGSVSLYTTFNVIFLGVLLPPEQVGPYAAAERLIRAGLGFIGQFTSAIFLRLNVLKATDPDQLERLRSRVVAGMVGVGVVGSGIAWASSPVVSRYLLGNRMPSVIPILHVMAFVVPAIAISSTLGYQYLLVNHLERTFNRIIFAAAAMNIPLGYCWVRRLAAPGMAWCWLSVEWLIAVALVWVVRDSRRIVR